MRNLWINIIKPRGIYAKWLVLLTLLGILALGVAGHFETTKYYLDTEEFSLSIGEYSVSAYELLRALIVIILVFWITAIISDFTEMRINRMKKLRASNRTLLLKLMQIFIYFIAFLFALDIVGIDLTTLTVFSGALGIGLGFGLQKISSNFISGLILLFEKSVEPDDLIELSDGTSGFVRKSNARYTLIETFDSREILVPNEDLITSRVINWTFSNTKGRVEISIGVSYASDIKKAQALILEAASEHPKSIEDPAPRCFLRNFGDSSIDFVLLFWIADITLGRWEPQSEVMFAIWDKFAEHGIEIPFPQRDLHLKTPETLQIKNNAKAKNNDGK